MPLGGSLVSFTPFCSTGTGKYGAGMDVRKRRKSALMGPASDVPARRSASVSTIFSSCGIHDLARWQFCSSTQSPELHAASMSACARGPCPCPSEMSFRRAR